jgi:hypothetical protein
MAQGLYKLNEAIKFTYQAANATTGLTVTMEIFDETGAKDLINFPDVTLTEIGTTGRYVGSLTPDATGVWTIMAAAAGGSGKIVKQYDVATYNVDAVGAAMAKDSTVAKDATVAKEASVAKEATLLQTEIDIRGVDGDTLKTLSDQIDTLPQVSPPMVG